MSLKITILSNAPFTNTGYGTQCKYIGLALKELGHEVSFLSNYGLHGTSLNWRGFTIYPMPESTEQWRTFVSRSRADVVLSLWDIWAMPFIDFDVPWIAYFPIDGEGIGDRSRRHIERADYAVVYSQFGKREMEKAALPCHYVPHGIDTDLFCPGDPAEARRELYPIPGDVFLVTVVAANKGYPARKAWPELLQGFAKFHARHPKSMLYLHTTSRPAGPGPEGGIFLLDLAKELCIHKAVAMPTQGELGIGVTDEIIAKFYRGSDVLLSPSLGEGFGLPIAEAQACGCPVVTQACSSMTELTVNGVAVEPLQRWWVPGLDCWWQYPSVDRIAEGLETVYRWSRRKRRSMSEKGVRFIRERHSWPVVKEHWRAFLEMVERDVKSGKVR
jgi:glycosyltransferase involved in cell wall biosynthesis